MSRSRAAEWIRDFEIAIKEENRTNIESCDSAVAVVSEQSIIKKSDKKKTEKRQEKKIGRKSDDKMPLVAGFAGSQQDAQDAPSCAGAHLQERPPKGGSLQDKKQGENFSFRKKSSQNQNSEIRLKREFQELVRNGFEQEQVRDKFKIELANGKIATIRQIGTKSLLITDGKIAKKEEALEIWQELFSYGNSVLGGLQVARKMEDGFFVLLRNNELFRSRNRV